MTPRWSFVVILPIAHDKELTDVHGSGSPVYRTAHRTFAIGPPPFSAEAATPHPQL